jgi:hypothetical protein
MATAKTTATSADVDATLAARASSPAQLADAQALVAMLSRVSGEPPRMWGPSIVGFGRYRYPLAGGKTGESCAAGFALRGREIVLYLLADTDDQAALLARLGPHRMGKACLYLKRLADVDAAVLERLAAGSLAELRRRHPG